MSRIDIVFDQIVYHAKVVERFENPAMKPLSKDDDERLTRSYQALADLRKMLKQRSCEMCLGMQGIKDK